MFYDGLSKRFALRLLDIGADNKALSSFNSYDENALRNTIYKDNFYLIKFIRMIQDNIQKSHKTLSYILRNQYINANSVYDQMTTDGDLDKIPTEMMRGLYEDVVKYIISPILRRYEIYSPTIIYVLFKAIYYSMLAVYIDGNKYNMMIKDVYSNIYEIDVEDNVWLHAIEKRMMKDELSVWKELKLKHMKTKK